VSAGGARRGRRDNGLDAAEYVAAGDVDPRVGEHLLDVLAAGGIAAYLQPATDLNPVTRTTTMPPRPTDRLYVDRRHLSTARDYLARLAADDDTADDPAKPPAVGPDAPWWPDVEAEWARIVASYNAEVDATSQQWPAAEHIDALDLRWADPTNAPADGAPPGDAPVSPGGPSAPRHLIDGRGVAEPSLLDGLETFGADLPDEDDDEGYTPPPPPPLPRISKYAVLGVLGVVGGFLLFLFPTVLPIDSTVSMLFGFTAILAGFVTLIWRLRPGGDEDDYDPDDGARV
jgi:hypothetical protein